MKTKLLGTPFSKTACKILFCGGGELGKETVIEFKRLGAEVVVLDRYEHAPAMQVADRSYTLSMLDGERLAEVIQKEQPDYIVPEIEAIATDKLVELEAQGFTVVPTAKATQLTMNREGIRRLAAEELELATSPYQFVDNLSGFKAAIAEIGMPCVVKPIMSSSGKGQSVIKHAEDIDAAWEYAQQGGRAGEGCVIVEGFVDFDYEITLLTIRHIAGTSFCEPIGHVQANGDYQQSWQPQAMSAKALELSQDIARKITDALGGRGLFGVELFIKGDDVYFSEVSPRPHDTGMVTLISQHLSEFALHARAVLGLPIPNIHFNGPSASSVILVEGDSKELQFTQVAEALSMPNTDLRLFGKPEVQGMRRMGVALARAEQVDTAVELAKKVSSTIGVNL
ncbi:formate-dependent phosphoribosylglycinamide formyltransferase [Pseudoalteromonas luteoviolacea]|uniref:Formate-dependent phosphoribosylglycinamide formyltransferase n=1 Tax=Pseudoalteromonas luteoviolacea DSM 6061 TaxID=1365250 RepID=A0A166YTR0_9GAMM|nr:formate-dependent phosphoribosylglycinamide formyltransferase [Pseudoalteromonas luteoviolacea]KZN43512.1 phosphoribosylglycinamide formyltransferase [Pseudoalteromonas luteoviolacea DSM 6061]MBE0388055.1 phosphoribosylglycinamide formyltransferase 2 [Pseudoalteromonas luteoviolacea DSM 6061]